MSIKNIGINIWHLDVHAKYGGKRRRLTVRGTKEFAKLEHARIEKECKGQLPDSRTRDKLTINDLTNLVVADYRRKNRRTISDAEQMREKWCAEYGSTTISAITHRALLTIADQWLVTLSPARVNRLMGFLLRGFSLLRRDEAHRDITVPFWEKLPEAPARSGFLEWEEFHRLRAAIEPHGKVPVTIGFWCGMREGELLSLEWARVKFNHSQRRVILDLRADLTKTSDPRVVVMTGDLYDALVDWHKFTVENFPDCAYVCHQEGRRLADTRYFWERACVAAGFGTWSKPEARHPTQRGYTGLIFHDLRRTGVRNLIRAGVPEKTAMAISGHKTRAVFDRYNIIDPRDLENAAEKLTDYMAMAEEERLFNRHGHSMDTPTTRKLKIPIKSTLTT